MTPEEFAAQQREQFPDPPGFPITLNGQPSYLSGAAYDAALADMVTAFTRQKQRRDEYTAWKQTITQYVAGMETLRDDLVFINEAIANDTNLTQAQVKKGFKDILQSLIWLGERIGDGTIMIRKPDSPS